MRATPLEAPREELRVHLKMQAFRRPEANVLGLRVFGVRDGSYRFVLWATIGGSKETDKAIVPCVPKEEDDDVDWCYGGCGSIWL
jgi:hypothetical protein